MAPPGIPGDLPGVLALSGMGLLPGGPHFPITRGIKMENTKVNLEYMESSASGDSDKGPCPEALQIGATGQDPVEHGVGETPLTGGHTRLLVTQAWRTWRA